MDRLEPNWVYIAGIIDGEGCISIYLHKVRNRKEGLVQYDSIFPRVHVINTSKELIDYLHSSTGFGTIIQTRPKNPKWKTRYDWEVSSPEQIKELMLNIKDYLVIKKKQCDLMLDYLENRINMMTFREKNGRVKKIPLEDNPNYHYVQEIHELNK